MFPIGRRFPLLAVISSPCDVRRVTRVLPDREIIRGEKRNKVTKQQSKTTMTCDLYEYLGGQDPLRGGTGRKSGFQNLRVPFPKHEVTFQEFGYRRLRHAAPRYIRGRNADQTQSLHPARETHQLGDQRERETRKTRRTAHRHEDDHCPDAAGGGRRRRPHPTRLEDFRISQIFFINPSTKL